MPGIHNIERFLVEEDLNWIISNNHLNIKLWWVLCSFIGTYSVSFQLQCAARLPQTSYSSFKSRYCGGCLQSALPPAKIKPS